MKRKILLATTVDWPSAARLAGAFATLGATVEAVFPRGHVLAVSRYVNRAHRYRPLRPLASFAEAIEAAAPDRIVPCDDRALAFLLRLEPQFGALLARSLGRLESYPVMMARSPSIVIAREQGIAAPLTLAVAHETLLPAALERVGLPAVLKTDGSWGGGGIAVVRSLAEAAHAYRALCGPPSRLRSLARAVLRRNQHFLLEAWAPNRANVSVQAFVPGKPATSVLACRDGRLLASLHMDVVEWEGIAGPARLMRRTGCPRMEEAAQTIARRFGLSGLIGLDFVRDKAGVPWLIEINPRATQICHLVLGPDLPAALLGRPPRPPATGKSTVALFPQLLTAPAHRRDVFQDVPRDDPAVLRALSPKGLPGEAAPDAVAELPTAGNGPAMRRSCGPTAR